MKRVILTVLGLLSAAVILYAADKIRTSKPELVFNTGHSRDARCVAFSSDGKFLASGGFDGVVKVWDAATGSELRTAGTHYGYVSDVKFSPDNTLLASCGEDKKILVWNTADWSPAATLEGHDAWVKSISFSADSRMLASSGVDPEIIIWNRENWRKIKTLKEQSDKDVTAVFSPDGKLLASGFSGIINWSSSGTVLIRETSNWSVVRTIKQINPEFICFSPDSRTLVIDGSIYDLSNGNKIGSFSFHNGISSTFIPDGKTILSSYINGGISINDPVNGNKIAEIALSKKTVWSIAINPWGTILAGGMSDGSIVYIDMKNKKELKYLSDTDTGYAADIYFRNDGTFVARKHGGKNITLWNMIKGSRVKTFQTPDKNVQFSFSGNGKLFAYTKSGGNVALVDTSSGKEIKSFDAVLLAQKTIDLNRDGSLLLNAYWNTIEIINTSTSKKIAIRNENVNLLKFSPDGRFIASASGSPAYSITIYNTSDGSIKQILKGHSNTIRCLDFSPDGKRLISGSGQDHEDSSLRLWDVENGNEIRVLKKKSGFILSAAFSPDGKKIAAVSSLKNVMLFDAASGNSIVEFDTDTPSLSRISFTKDGSKLMIGSTDGIIRFYDIEKRSITAKASFSDENNFVIAANDGRYDATKFGFEKLHWVSGNEVIMLRDLDKGFNKKGLFPILAGFGGKTDEIVPDAVDVSKQLIGKIGSISGKEIVVNSSRTLAMGDKIFLLSGSKKITLEVTFPMMTVAKCRVVNSADAGRVKKGMPVFR